MREEAKVGLIVMGGILLLILILAFLGAFRVSLRYYRVHVLFSEVQGLEKKAPVYLSGVKIGKVSSVKPTKDGQVDVELQIAREIEGQRIILRRGYRFTISMGGALIGEKNVTIRPGLGAAGGVIGDNETVVGENPTSFEDLLTQARDSFGAIEKLSSSLRAAFGEKEAGALRDTIVSLRKVVQGVGGLVPEIEALVVENKGEIKRAIANLGKVSGEASKVLRTLEKTVGTRGEEIGQAINNLNRATEEARSLLENVNAVIRENRDNVKKISSELVQTSASLRKTSASVESFVSEKGEEIKAIVSNIKSVSEKIDMVAGRLKELAQDRKLEQEVKETITSAKEALVSVKKAAERVEQVFPTGEKITRAVLGTKPEMGVDLYYRGGEGRLQSDLNVKISPTETSFYTLGIYDLGEASKLNLQLGLQRVPSYDLRFGLVRSKVGLGTSYLISPQARATLELYDPKEPRMNLFGDYRVSDQWGLHLGLEVAERERLSIFGFRYYP